MKKNCAGMAEEKNSDHVSLGLEIGDQNAVVFLGDFSGGNADIRDGSTGTESTYILSGKRGSNELRLLKDGEVKFYLNGCTVAQHSDRHNKPLEKQYLPLAKGQIFKLTPESNVYDVIELKLNVLCI
jgi:hypothetical protein